ncbi:MAG: class I SAM-dependent methyltransferase [Gallionella sp.]|jgi:SAM-dependent methyltransferase
MPTAVEVKVTTPWEFYLQKSKEVVGHFVSRPKVLKADAHNETSDNIPMKGGIAGNIVAETTLLELKSSEVARAKELGFNAVQGDIRQIPFPDDTFNIVIDCSTLDHLHSDDVPKALAEYQRVLKQNGICLLFCWVTDKGDWGNTGYFDDPNKHSTFQHAGLVERFEQNFVIQSEELFNRTGDRYMTCLIGSAKR